MKTKITFDVILPANQVLAEMSKLCGYSGKWSVISSPERFMEYFEALNGLPGVINIEVIYE